MIDPFSLLPLSVAAHGGRVDDFEAQQLVAAGLTLLRRSAPLVRALSGKRAAILLPTSPAFIVALAAAEGRGAVLINPLAARFEIAHQLKDANVGSVFTTSALAANLPDSFPKVLLDDAPRRAQVAIDNQVRDIDLGTHIGMPIEGNADAPGSDEEAVIVYTSAMAGTPLGAILSHRNLLANGRATIQVVGNNADDRVLALLPYSHLFGLTATCTAPLLAAASVVTMAKFSSSRAMELISTGSITEVVGVPSVYRALLSVMERRGSSAVGALRVAICGGAPLTVELQDRWFDATGVELRQGYGLTEAGPVSLYNSVDRPNLRGSLGSPLPGVDIELFDAVTYDELGRPRTPPAHSSPVANGEICIRGDNVFRGYVSGGELGLPVRDGWLHSGDLGRRDADGTIHFAGLIKPMFTRNGFNIYPREIERVVGEMQGVVRIDAREVAAAIVDREPEIALDVEGNVTEDDVKLWCAERLSAYKQPAVIVVR
ncbi:MAG TPA: AMP-binding protein [Gemmatimonadaceae bacterium]|nr:AMP-binding protein [Gemmatimonadaceae bacterium]